MLESHLMTGSSHPFVLFATAVGLIFAVVVLFHAMQNPVLSNPLKFLWAVLIFVAWMPASFVYGVFLSKLRWMKWTASGVTLLSVLSIIYQYQVARRAPPPV
jgi:hypothetical protein